MKTLNQAKPHAKVFDKNRTRPFGSIQIDLPESIRRKTVSPAFLSIDSSIVGNEMGEKFTDIIDLDDSFKLSVFIEFFMYHFCFLFLMGPFLPVILYPFTKSFARFRNMMFWNFSIEFNMQTFLFLFSLGALFGYFYLNSSNIYFIEMFGLIVGGLLRICVISIKYGHFSDQKLFYVKNANLTSAEISSEFISLWSNQEDFTIDKELYTCILKNNIDSSIFRMFFLKPLKPSIAEQLAVSDEDLETPNGAQSGSSFNNMGWLKEVWIKSFDVVKKNLFGKQTCEEGTYSGYLVSLFLIKESKELFIKPITIFYLSLTLAIIQSLIPTFFRIAEKETLLGQNLPEILVILGLLIGNIHSNHMNLFMLIYGAFEYDRPIHLLSQLSNLLSSKKVTEYYVRKSLPTLNIFCPISYKSWYYMNKIFRTYGEKFLNRVEMILGVFLFFNLLMTVFCVLAIYDFLGPLGQKVNIAFLAYGMLVMFVIIFVALRKGATINELYDIHRDILKNNKDIISDLITLYPIYFEKEEYDSDNEIYYHAIKLFKIHNEGLPPEVKKERVIKHLENLKGMTDDIIEQLAFSKERRPFKIFGIPATSALLKSIFAGLGTVVVAGLQKFLSTR